MKNVRGSEYFPYPLYTSYTGFMTGSRDGHWDMYQVRTSMYSVTPFCPHTFSSWSDLALIRDQELWIGPQLQWHINCLELLAVWHVSVLLQNAATREACAGPYRQHCEHCVNQPPRRSTLLSHVATRPPSPLWSQKHLRSLHAVHVPGELNRAADELLCQPALPGEWRLHPEVVQLI